ncbi:bacteriohemerythrin [Azospirillum sp. sgz301742]
MAWDDSWRTGHSVFDLDHKQLATLLDLLEDSLAMLPGSGYPASMAQRLVIEAREHFRREEAYLLQHPTPDTEQHIVMHEAFSEKLEALAAAVARSDEPAARALIAEAHTMFVEHLLPADAAMVAYFKERSAVVR